MFTLEQLVSFGEYLLSDERIARVQEERANEKDEMLDRVHVADVISWHIKYAPHLCTNAISDEISFYQGQNPNNKLIFLPLSRG